MSAAPASARSAFPAPQPGSSWRAPRRASSRAEPATAFGNPQTVALGTQAAQYHPRVALNDDEVAVAWSDLSQTHPSQPFSADAAPSRWLT